MSGIKRRKQLARDKYERQQTRRAADAQRAHRHQRIVALVVVLVLVAAGVTWFLIARGSSAGSPTAAASSAAPASSTASATASASASGASAAPGLDCTEPGALREDNLSWDKAPAESSKASTLTLTTNCGKIAIALDPKAPKTLASEAFLASQGFYDGTKCHRLTTEGIYVLQCGDPKGDGTGIRHGNRACRVVHSVRSGKVLVRD